MKTFYNNTDPLRNLWDETNEPLSGSQEQELKALHHAMGVNTGVTRRVSPRPWLYAMAFAAFLALIMVGEFFVLNNRIPASETVSLVTSATSKGEFTLPDGSHVWLNSGSSLSYNKSNPRLVTLEGEGFFDVAKKDGQKFVVSTGTLDVTVLGTQFNVRSSSHFEGEEVSLLSGRVEIHAGESSVLLSPGEKAYVANNVIEKQTNDVTFDSSWTGRELVFDNVALSDILTSFEHWYNVNMHIDPSVNVSTRLSFKIQNESEAESQKIISRLTGCRFKTLDEQNVIITRR